MSSLTVGGWPVVVAPALPRPSTPAEDAKRIVRRGLADVLTWLGEDVGPEPGEPTHAYISVDPATGSGAIYASEHRAAEIARWMHELHREAV